MIMKQVEPEDLSEKCRTVLFSGIKLAKSVENLLDWEVKTYIEICTNEKR